MWKVRLFLGLALIWPDVVALYSQVAGLAHLFAKHFTVRVLTSSRELLAAVLHVAPAAHPYTEHTSFSMWAVGALLKPRDRENVGLSVNVQFHLPLDFFATREGSFIANVWWLETNAIACYRG